MLSRNLNLFALFLDKSILNLAEDKFEQIVDSPVVFSFRLDVVIRGFKFILEVFQINFEISLENFYLKVRNKSNLLA